MKKIILFTLLLVICNTALPSPKILRAYLAYASFSVPGATPTLETYLAVDGKSVVFKETEPGHFRSSIQITLMFKQADTISSFAKYELLSPVTTDTSVINFGFIDFQRYALTQGEYDMEIIISDLNNLDQPPFSTNETLQIYFPENQMSFSGIQWVERYEKSEKPSVITKNGMDIVPHVFSFFPSDTKKLTYYTELYNTLAQFGKDSKFLLNSYIRSYESGIVMQGKLTSKRMETKEVNVILQSFDIADLPSGNYELVVEARDRDNKVICQNTSFFQRSNPGMQHAIEDLSALNIEKTFASKIVKIDTLRENLLSLEPLSTEFERDYVFNLVKTDDLLTMQRYLYNFWYKRNISQPEAAWNDYNFQVKRADFSFATRTKKGYQTDRGRVFLKYGPPDQISENHNEPGAYPYEIWHYYQLNNQRNKRFVFSSKDIVTNDFILIHSDAFGELTNYRWQADIYSRTWDGGNIDDTRPEDIWGNKATDYFNNPR